MSSIGPTDNSNKIVLPIGYTVEADETVDEILQKTIEADQNITELKAKESTLPRRGRGTGDTTSSSAFARAEDRSEFGGIFSTSRADLGVQGKDKTSAQAIQRENQFTKLRDQVQDMQQQMTGTEKLQQGVGVATQAVGFGQFLGGAGASGIMGKVAGIASKAFIPLAVLTTVIEVAKSVLDEALKPGGPLDRRFKRIIGDEIASATSLEEKAEVNQGFKVVRISTQPGLRGEAGVVSNLQKRTVMYDLGVARSMQGLQG